MTPEDDDEFELFRKTMEAEGIRRQKVRGGQHHPAKRKSGNLNHGQPSLNPAPGSKLTTATIDHTNDGPMVLFVRSGIQKSLLKKLQQGVVAIEESVDLHGLRSHAAERALDTFLAEAIQYGNRCIQIIHGKGQRSEQAGGVLKPLTIHWLKKQPEVLAFCSCTPRNGGSGATCVLLHSTIESSD